MTAFDTFVVVDWSAGKDRGPTPKRDAIWIGAVRAGVPVEPRYCRTRCLAEDHLTKLFREEIEHGRRVLAAFDFPFGYPRGFVECITGSDDPLAFWQWLEERVKDDEHGTSNRFEIAADLNRRFPGPGPFWGKPWQWRDELTDVPFGKVADGVVFAPFPEYRECDRQVRAATGKTLSSCFQMFGNPTVGGQVLTGLPVLERLRRVGRVRVWPFETLDDADIVLAETWPSLIDGAVSETGDPIRDRAQVRLLSLALARMDPEELAGLFATPEVAREEAWILGASVHVELAQLALGR